MTEIKETIKLFRYKELDMNDYVTVYGISPQLEVMYSFNSVKFLEDLKKISDYSGDGGYCE